MKTLLKASAIALAMSMAGGAYAATEKMPSPMFMVETPDWVKTVTSSNMFEIESSKLAEQKGTTEDVKTFAAQMIKDHTKAGEDLKATLEKAKMQPPPEALSPKHAAMMKLLQDANGTDFEMLYIDMQASAHMEAVSLFQTYAGSGDNAAVKAFAKATLPTLEMHKMHVKKLVAAH